MFGTGAGIAASPDGQLCLRTEGLRALSRFLETYYVNDICCVGIMRNRQGGLPRDLCV